MIVLRQTPKAVALTNHDMKGLSTTVIGEKGLAGDRVTRLF